MVLNQAIILRMALIIKKPTSVYRKFINTTSLTNYIFLVSQGRLTLGDKPQG